VLRVVKRAGRIALWQQMLLGIIAGAVIGWL
jgi:hypothetical protein